MKGFISNIFKLTILTLAVIGFMSIGGMDFLKNTFSNIPFFKNSPETLMEKANKIADFSNINKEEYEISKTANMMGYKAVVAEHNASGQKFIILEPGKEKLLTKQDFENGQIDEKIKNLHKKIEKQFIHIKNVQVVKKSSMKTMNQTVPYAKIEAEPVNMPGVKKITGIIGVAAKNDKENIILSFNTDGKYSQIITEQFFKDVK